MNQSRSSGPSVERKPVFCIVDPCLVDFIGHHLEYDRSTATAAAKLNFQPLILSHKRVVPSIAETGFVIPTFSMTIWDSNPKLADRPGENNLFCNRTFFQDLIQGLKGVSFSDQDVVFGHMITERQLLGWAWFARKYVRRGGPKLVLLLRYQASAYSGDLCQQAFRILERVARKGSVRLVSDSARLARQIERLTDLPVDEVAIPHTTDLSEISQPTTANRRLRAVSLGNARDEKGFLEILESIRILHEEHAGGPFDFVLQANDAQPDVQAAVDAFDKLRLPGVTLIREALSSEDYYNTLLGADVVLLPYWRSIYEARTSGVFLEAVAAGKPVVCTDDCWMTDQLEIAGAGVKCRDRDARSLVRAILSAAENYATLEKRARDTRAKYLERHNAERLVREIVFGVEPIVSGPTRPRVAIFYPWGDALVGRAGASVRLNLLLDYLGAEGADVRVLQTGTEEGDKGPSVKVEAYQTEPPKREEAKHRFERICERLGMSSEGAHHLWWHLSVRWDAGFRRRVREMVRWSDVVILKYTFWGSVVAPICRELGKRYLIADHDIVSDQVRAPLLRWITRLLEFRALAGADYVVSVAAGDQQIFAKSGIASTLVPNPVDFAAWNEKLPFDTLEVLESLYDLPLQAVDFCLFVGSGFEPNRIAAERIREVAKEFRQRSPQSGPLFIVAGGCAEAVREENFWALGRVDDFVLHALYQHAKVVLIPLPFGTGSSLKTVEAFAAGKAVVGTDVAFRGLAIQSGKECIVEQDMAAYPDLLNNLLEDSALRASLGDAARQLAARFDYRESFKNYLPLLGVTLSGRELDPKSATHLRTPQAIAMARVLARRAVERNRMKEAAEFASLVLTHDPEDAEIHFLLGQILAGQEPPNLEALKHFDLAQDNGFDQFSVLRARSVLMRRVGDAAGADLAESRAIGALIAASQFDPLLLKLRKRLWDLFHESEFDTLVKICRKTHATLAAFPHADTYYLLALSLQSLGCELEEARRHYDRALELGFDEFWVRVHRGRVRQALGDDAGAADDFARAARLKPDDRSAQDMLASARLAPLWRAFNAKDYESVVRDGRAALERKETGEVHYLIAQSLDGLERELKEARRHYDRALELGFDEFWVRIHRGRLRQVLGDDAGAADDFGRAARLKPDDRTAQDMLASVRLAPLWRAFNAKDYESVVRDGRAALEREETGEVHYLIAQSLHSLERELEEARRHYDRALELGFDEFWVRVHRGRLRQALGDDEGAESDFSGAARIKPDDRSAQDMLASARLAPLWRAFNAKDYERVVRDGRAALEREETGEVHYLIAQSLHSLEREVEEARRHYDRALELGFDEFWVRVHRGRLRQALGDDAGAADDFSRAARLKPDDRSARDMLASARLAPLWRAFNAKDYERVVRDGRAVLEGEETGEVHYLIAQSLHSLERELEEARRHYDRALELGFDEFWVRYHRGRVRQALGDDAGAAGDLDRAARIKPDDRSAQDMLASARLAPLWRAFNAMDYERVVRDGRAALELKETGEVHYLIAQSLHSLERELEEARRHYDRALELGFDEFWVRYHRGRVRQALGDDAGAADDFSRAASLKPDDRPAQDRLVSARLALLWRAFNTKDYESVVRDGRAALEREETGEVHYLIAQSLHSLERELEEARRHYDRALELGFDEFWVRYHRGRVRQALGDDAGAASDLDRAARLKPDDKSAQDMLAWARLAPLWRAFNAKDYESVLRDGRAALELEETGEVHYLIAQSLHSLERELEEARRHYDRALELGFDEFWVRYHRARLLFSQQIEDRATADIVRALELQPDNANARRTLFWFRMAPLWRAFDEKRFESVIEQARALSQLHREGELDYILGLCLQSLDARSTVALEHYNRALEAGFDEYWVRHHRGRLLSELGDDEGAEADRARAAEMRPSNVS